MTSLFWIAFFAPPAGTSIDIEDPGACGPCHAAILAEWGQSMHARAHHSRDPIYRAMRSARMKTEGAAVARSCAKCHTPRAKPGDVEGGLRGVSCATCHNTAAVHPGGIGRDGLIAAPAGVLLGPRDVAPNASPAHLTGKSPTHFADGATLCLACHDQLANAKGVALCATGLEWKSFGIGGCTNCHMPSVDAPNGVADRDGTHRDHRFIGPHGARAGTRELQAAGLQARFRGDWIEVTLVNHAGHALPSGFPSRWVQIAIKGFDKAGAEVWRLPADLDRALLRRVFVDNGGRPTMPAMAVDTGPDTRLRPGEVRTLTFAVSPLVEKAEVRLLHRPLPPAMARTLGLESEPRMTPRTLAQRTIQR